MVKGLEGLKILVRNEFKRNTKTKTVSSNQSMYFVVNNLAIPKQLIGLGGMDSNA